MTAVNLNRAIRGPVTAVPVVAGKGVRIVADTVNNRFVAEADETVLWEGNSPMNYGGSATVSESLRNFDRIRIYWKGEYGTERGHMCCSEVVIGSTSTLIAFGGVYQRYNSGKFNIVLINISYDDTNLSVTMSNCARYNMNSATPIDWSANSSNLGYIYKIVGVNRIASN